MITLKTSLEDNFTVSVTGVISYGNGTKFRLFTYHIGGHNKTKESVMNDWVKLLNKEFPGYLAGGYDIQYLVVNPIK